MLATGYAYDPMRLYWSFAQMSLLLAISSASHQLAYAALQSPPRQEKDDGSLEASAPPSIAPPATVSEARNYNEKFGRVRQLSSSSMNLGMEALRNERPPSVATIDNIEKRQLAFEGKLLPGGKQHRATVN